MTYPFAGWGGIQVEDVALTCRGAASTVVMRGVHDDAAHPRMGGCGIQEEEVEIQAEQAEMHAQHT